MPPTLEQPPTPTPVNRTVWIATLWLIVATAFWGAGFTWGKSAQHSINLAGPGEHSPVGPLLFLAVRFLLAGAIWMAVFWSRAGRGWSWGTARRSIILGALLGGGLVVQHLALDRSSEAVVAFLTTLSIVFVPLLSVVVLRCYPSVVTWLGIAVALFGVWRLTGGSPRGMGVGEWLGVGCAVVFSIYLLTLNALMKRDTPWRLTGGQFIFIGVCCALAVLCLPGGAATLHPTELQRLFGQPGVMRELALMLVLPTIGAFALMMFFQPKLDPTRAALIYLLEPIWAGAFAWMTAGKPMTREELQGAALILAANGLVELLAARRHPKGLTWPQMNADERR